MNNENISGNDENCKKQIRVFPTQMDTQSFGFFQTRATSFGDIPIANATVSIFDPNNPSVILEQLTTDESGLTETIPLPAPNIDFSLEPSPVQPYSVYDLQITAPEFETANFANVEILPEILAEQEATLIPTQFQEGTSLFVIPPHTLFGEYPPKIAESEIKPVGETGEIVLERVVIPEFIIVHDGPPQSAAPDYWVRFRDYIKNVASSEIYATWPEATIYANVLAILSFTLNRVYTEWYRGQGYNFNITSSTAFDQKWINGRNIYNTISVAVDSVFVNYLSRPNIRQPILTQYCDGNRVQCPNWLSQWGSKTLGDRGLSAIQILRNYYGNSIYINTAPEVSGVPASWQGNNLTVSSSGSQVRIIQEQLNRIAQVYTAIPRLAVDGAYGPRTAESVRAFQRIFNMPVTGVVDRSTWYRISHIFVGVTRIAAG